MKSRILDRPMFAKPIDESNVENVGIMQGFMDEMEAENELEMDEDYQTQRVLDRNPTSPEILMNNLRGDMRSVDARVEELADLVGYNAAMETPPDVLALLQPVLAAQQMPQGGIPMPPPGMPPMPPEGMPPEMMGGMPPMPPEGMPPMPPEGMPPMPPEMMGGMPPEAAMGGIGALPMDQGPMPPPVAMAAGGYVQSFSDGSDEDGVTPSRDTSSFPAGTFSPDEVAEARQAILARLTQKPLPVPDLSAQTESRIPLYEKLLGADKNLSQAQILFELGQRAFNYGANVDDQGRLLRGSQAARLAGATRTLPGSMGNILAQQAQQDRAVRATALQAAEKDVQGIRDQNVKLSESQRKLQSDIIKSGAKGTGAGPLGSSLRGRILDYLIVNAPSFAEGQLSPEESRRYKQNYLEAIAPIYKTDPETGAETVIRPQIDDEIRKSYLMGLSRQGLSPQGLSRQGGSPEGSIPPLSFGQDSVVVGTPSPKVYKNTDDPLKVDPYIQNYVSSPKERTTLFNQASGTGLASGIASFWAKTPFVGALAPEGVMDASEQKKNLENLALQLNRGIANNPKFAEGEQKRIFETIELLPKLWDRKEAYIQRVVALDDYLKGLQEDALSNSINERLHVNDRNDAKIKAANIHSIRKDIGAPISFGSTSDPRLRQLPEGTRVLINGKIHRTGRQ
jgi:hypothetical protein